MVFREKSLTPEQDLVGSIAISATEHSGDLLASELIKYLCKNNAKLSFFGLAGAKMLSAGCHKIWDIDSVSVMGFSEVLKKLPQLIILRKQIINEIIRQKPQLFIGVDGPDFNLKIEQKLKQHGIKTLHFISPSLWAWRAYRVRKIKKCADIILCLFPFEVDFYRKHKINAVFVGHPLTKILTPRSNYIKNNNILIMPGSRSSEIKAILPTMLDAVSIITKNNTQLKFSLALLDDKLLSWIKPKITNLGLDIKIVLNSSHKQLQKSDLVIIASGTATLEALIIGVPMVVVYKLATISYLIAKILVNIPYISLPNILSNEPLVPELVQKNACGDNIAKEVLKILVSDNTSLIAEFNKIYHKLHQDSNAIINKVITELL